MALSRLALAESIARELRSREGRNLVAAGVIGSVALGRDRTYSDLDLLVLLRRKRKLPRYVVREGVLVTFLRQTPEEARREVRGAYPSLPEALAGWRSVRTLHDPSGILRRLRTRAYHPSASQFREAARLGILSTYEDLGKLRNAAEAGELEIAREMAIWYTGGATMMLFCLERHVPDTDATIFVEAGRQGKVGRDLCTLRYERLSLRRTREIAEGTWSTLLRRARRQGITADGLG